MHPLTAYKYTFLRKMLCTWEFHVYAMYLRISRRSRSCLSSWYISSLSSTGTDLRSLYLPSFHWFCKSPDGPKSTTPGSLDGEKTSRTRRGMSYANLPTLVRTSSYTLTTLLFKRKYAYISSILHMHICAHARAHTHTHACLQHRASTHTHMQPCVAI